jgi:predicted nucleic acid-binding protein
MIVVSNTSPITNLATIGQLELLPKLYSQVIIPQAVYEEIVISGSGKPGAAEVQAASWIEVKKATDQTLVAKLELELDQGEAESIALSLELKADLVLLDERQGRKVGVRFGLNMIGLLGILIEAKRQGLIVQVQPLLEELRTKAGFWIGDKLYQQVIQIAGESHP